MSSPARQLGVEVCTDICRKALAHGVKGIHFYCLNRVQSVSEVLHNLGLARDGKCIQAGMLKRLWRSMLHILGLGPNGRPPGSRVTPSLHSAGR